MYILRIMSVVFASMFFSEAIAQDTLFTSLVSCDISTSKNDPSIISRKRVDRRTGCAGYAVEVALIDQYYGFQVYTKALPGKSNKAHVVEPSEEDVYSTHKPCRRVFLEEAFVREWLVPRDESCDGRPTSVHRIYTRDSKICLMPGEHCIEVSRLTERGQRRFREMLRITYAGLAQ